MRNRVALQILQQSIEAAQLAVLCHRHHQLNPGDRQAIYIALSTQRHKSAAIDSPGRQRRVQLDILTTRKVLPRWVELWPNDDTPQRLLRAAAKVVDETLRRQVAQESWDTTWAKLEALARDPRYQSATFQDCISVGLSASCALSTALDKDQVDPAKTDYTLADTDTDVFSKDAAFWACTSYAGAI